MSGSDYLWLNLTEAPEDCDNPFQDRIYSTVAAVAAASGLVSLLASCFTIFIILLFQKWRSFSQRLVLYLAIASALRATAVLVQRVDYHHHQASPSYTKFCMFAGYANLHTSWTVLNAATCLTISLLLLTYSSKQPDRYEFPFLLYIFAFPLLLTWVPFVGGAYGKEGAWCWIRSRDECEELEFGQVLQVVLWHAPLYALLLILTGLSTTLAIVFRRRGWSGGCGTQLEGPHPSRQVPREVILMIACPLALLLLNAPALANLICTLTHPEDPVPALWFLSGMLCPLQGPLVALAFSLDPETRRRLAPTSFWATCREMLGRERVRDYPARDSEKEASLQVQLLRLPPF